MREGWGGDDYLILFNEEEQAAATARYKLGEALPGFVVIGFQSWDYLIVRDPHGAFFTVPAVPLDWEYLTPSVDPGDHPLEPDARFMGKIQWLIKPLVFGGDSNAHDNIAWITHEKHGELVQWWNGMYRKTKRANRGTEGRTCL